MNRGSAVAVAVADMSAEFRNTLHDPERDRLLGAIETAIKVVRKEQFHAWLRGPFHALLPHDSLVCLETDKRGVRPVASLHHALLDALAAAPLDHALNDLATRLVLAYRGNRRQTCTVDSAALAELLPPVAAPGLAGGLHNAVIHRMRLLSGATYCLVMINVAADRLDRCRHLFKLLSLHLKMALSQALTAPASPSTGVLSARDLEILRLIAKGSSNREISAALGISAITLKSQLARLYRKLDVQNRADAVARGLGAPAAPAQDPPVR